MNDDFSGTRQRGTSDRRLILPYLVVPALCFLVGVAAMGWLLSRWDAGARMIGVAQQAPAETLVPGEPPALSPQTPAEPPAPEAEAPERIMIDPEITRRVAELERRIGQVDSQSRAAVGNADRAEGLLVAFAARRALDRGVPLGFLEALLRQRFGDSQPQAVGIVITAAREPVTLQELQEQLQELAPELAGGGSEQGWWDAFRAELGSLVTVRREGTPSPEPEERLRRASRHLEAGQVDVALAEVARLPGRARASEWIAKARRHVMARRALDAIETAALVEPRAATPPATPPRPVRTAAPRPAASP